MSKNDIRALINKKAQKIRSIRDKTNDKMPIKDWMLDFLNDVDGLRKHYNTAPKFHGAILSKVCVLEGKIKSIDPFARVELEFSSDLTTLEAIAIRWGRRYREANNMGDDAQRFQIMDILLREFGLE